MNWNERKDRQRPIPDYERLRPIQMPRGFLETDDEHRRRPMMLSLSLSLSLLSLSLSLSLSSNKCHYYSFWTTFIYWNSRQCLDERLVDKQFNCVRDFVYCSVFIWFWFEIGHSRLNIIITWFGFNQKIFPFSSSARQFVGKIYFPRWCSVCFQTRIHKTIFELVLLYEAFYWNFLWNCHFKHRTNKD